MNSIAKNSIVIVIRRNLRKNVLLSILIVLMCFFSVGCQSGGSPYGIFEKQTDVGDVNFPGVVKYDSKSTEYQITGSGANIWDDVDAFCYAWKKVSGDLKLVTDISWVAEEGNEHRKAGWMIRQDLEPDSAYVDAVAHGNGLISLQYRSTQGALTDEIQSAIPAPATLKLIREGDVFTAYVSDNGKSFETVGDYELALTDPVYVGLVVCSHDNTVSETAIFTNVKMKQKGTSSGKQ